MMSSIKRTPYQTLAAFLVLYFTLFLISVIFISMSFLYGLIGYVETRPQVTVYFQNETSQKDIFALRDELNKSGKASSIKYISKEQAFIIFKNESKDNPLLVEMTSPTVLPPSLEIYAKKPEYLPQIAQFLENKPGVDEVQYQKIIVDKLLSLTRAIKTVTFALCGFLFLMSTIVIVATSSFKIALRKEEIEILQLLGASKFFIVKPFIAEGFWLGFFSALFSSVTIIVGMFFVQPALSGYLRGIPAIDLPLIADISLRVWPMNIAFVASAFALSTFFGILIGVFANLLASKKYLS